MNAKRTVAIIAVLTVLAIGTATPTAARATDVSDPWVLAGIATAAYVGLVVIGTMIVYGPPNRLALTPDDLGVRRDTQEVPVRVGPRCRQTGTALTLVCW